MPVHLVNGLWGVLAVGIFANGNPITAGWNGVASPVTGLLYGGTFSQMLAQLIEVVAIVIMVGGLSLVFFKILNALKLLRSEPADELTGLDMPGDGRPRLYHGRRPDGRRPALATDARRAPACPHSNQLTRHKEAISHDQEN